MVSFFNSLHKNTTLWCIFPILNFVLLFSIVFFITYVTGNAVTQFTNANAD